MLATAIYARLAATSAVTALVGTRIMPIGSPSNTYPLIVYDIDQEKEESIDEMVGKEFFVTLTMVAGGPGVTDAYTRAHAVASAVKTALDRQKGTWGGIVVGGCFFNGASEEQFYEGSNSEVPFCEVEHTYRVWAAA
jgi:hypothetical protein